MLCCFFVQSSKSQAHRECPTEQINGLENLLRVLIYSVTLADCRWFSITSRHFLTFSAQCVVIEVEGSTAFILHHHLMLPTPRHDCFAFYFCLSLAAEYLSLTQSLSNNWLPKFNCHLKITPSLDLCTRECFLMRRAGLWSWVKTRIKTSS